MTRAVPGVSICLPTYNGARYLRECLASALAQTHGDFELVVVDDRSTDETMDIIRDVAHADSRVRVFENDANLGLVGNWNRCIELSSAPWIKFVFQDDLLATDCVRHLLDAAAAGFPLISCARDFLFQGDATPETKAPYLRNRALLDGIYAGSFAMDAHAFCEATLDHIGINLVGEPTAVLLHRDVFRRFGTFDPRLAMYCDAEYWSRVACNTGTMHVPDVLATFRVHAEATSARNVASRAFRANALDKLLIHHELAFADAYAPLRVVARARTPPVDLEALFWERAHWARWHARRAASGTVDPDPGSLRAWEEFVTLVPRVTSTPLKARAMRVGRGIARRLRRFAASEAGAAKP
ncbi:MAG TPA: glycosyltransferase family 2 protein [Casimicrobiaceae bacterium]|nr:glycosyltransferase family 2 protein [Casimicrobiaceae bacterium]